tara:strand:+ start:894 stop:1064 length:171 start_codon:yes stop_codon:yes gene_type:complete
MGAFVKEAITFGASLVAKTDVYSIFEKKGHEFVDVGVNLFDEEDKDFVMIINLIPI